VPPRMHLVAVDVEVAHPRLAVARRREARGQAHALALEEIGGRLADVGGQLVVGGLAAVAGPQRVEGAEVRMVGFAFVVIADALAENLLMLLAPGVVTLDESHSPSIFGNRSRSAPLAGWMRRSCATASFADSMSSR